MVAKGVEWTATRAVEQCKGKGKTKAAKEEDSEQLRLNPGLNPSLSTATVRTLRIVGIQQASAASRSFDTHGLSDGQLPC